MFIFFLDHDAITKHLQLDRFNLFKIVWTILKFNCFKIALFSGSQKNCIEIVLLYSEKLELFVIVYQSGKYFVKSTTLQF
jgi:hypothetical protein